MRPVAGVAARRLLAPSAFLVQDAGDASRSRPRYPTVMKRVITALLLVLALVPLLLLTRWGGEAKAPWSASRDGVRARLVASRSIWRTDEAIDLRLRIQSRARETRVIGQSVTGTLVLRREGAEIDR